MTSKTAAPNPLTTEEAKYRDLIDEGLREFKEIEREIRSTRATSERLRASSRRVMEDTWEVLHRVEATL